MRKIFVIGATLLVMGFVACTQPSQPVMPGAATWRNVQSSEVQPTTDTYVPDIETSSKDENLDEITVEKLKAVGKKVQHTFSNGEKLRFVSTKYGDVIVGGDHGTILTRVEYLPKFIKDKEIDFKKISKKSTGVTTSVANRWPNNAITFAIDSGFTPDQLTAIGNAINWWNNSSIGVK